MQKNMRFMKKSHIFTVLKPRIGLFREVRYLNCNQKSVFFWFSRVWVADAG